MLSINYHWSKTAAAISLGFGNSGCFALEVNGVPIKGFSRLEMATREYARMRQAVESRCFAAANRVEICLSNRPECR